MPFAFYLGLGWVIVLTTLWIVGMHVLRRARRSGFGGELSPADDRAARDALASGRDAAALAMAARAGQARLGR